MSVLKKLIAFKSEKLVYVLSVCGIYIYRLENFNQGGRKAD